MEILTCGTCDMIAFRPMAEGIITTVPQTRDRREDCGFVHQWTLSGEVDVRAFVHVALSTVLRRVDLPDWHRDGIHTTQEALGALSVYRRIGWPSRLIDGHDVTSDGLVTARLMAKWVAGQTTAFKRAMVWRSAGGLLSVSL